MSGDLTDGFDLNTGTDAPLPETGAEAAVERVPAGPSIDDAIASAFEAQTAAERARDEQGRFTAKPAGQQQPAQTPAAATDKAAQQPAQAPVQPETGMPSSWGRGKEALWQQASPELRQFLAQREQQISEGFRRYEGCAEFADVAAQNGKSLRDVLTKVDRIETGLMTDPVSTLVQIAQMYRVDPAALAARLQGGAQPAPAVSAASPQAPVPAFDPRQVSQLVQQELQKQSTAQQVEAFWADPANKYADQVADVMAALLRADRNLSIKDAYDRAIWADPQIRSELEREAALAKQVEQAKAARAATQTAQRASRSIVGNGGPASTGAKPVMSVEESINAALAAHG
jgi:hypothetical protein